MIITVTMNPAIDKTIDVDQFEVGGLNRIQRSVLDVGGKGINVSKTINAIGGSSIATGFVGGSTGHMIQTTLQELGIITDFVQVDGETRTNTKVFSNNYPVTELNEQGAEITPNQLDQLLQKLDDYANMDALFVLAGSIPKGVPADIYSTITKRVRQQGARVLLDADGALFKASLGAKPDIIKPNREELAEFAGKKTLTRDELIDIAKGFLADGISTVVISMGKDGALFVTDERVLQCDGLKVQAHSTVGAGDAMVAGLSYSSDRLFPLDKMVTLSVATSAGAVTTVGTKPPSLELVQTLQKQVVINTL